MVSSSFVRSASVRQATWPWTLDAGCFWVRCAIILRSGFTTPTHWKAIPRNFQTLNGWTGKRYFSRSSLCTYLFTCRLTWGNVKRSECTLKFLVNLTFTFSLVWFSYAYDIIEKGFFPLWRHFHRVAFLESQNRRLTTFVYFLRRSVPDLVWLKRFISFRISRTQPDRPIGRPVDPSTPEVKSFSGKNFRPIEIAPPLKNNLKSFRPFKVTLNLFWWAAMQKNLLGREEVDVVVGKSRPDVHTWLPKRVDWSKKRLGGSKQLDDSYVSPPIALSAWLVFFWPFSFILTCARLDGLTDGRPTKTDWEIKRTKFPNRLKGAQRYF